MRARRVRSASVAASALLVALAAMGLWSPVPAEAQAVTDAMSGFSTDSDEPVNIEADELEVLDRERRAVFTGNVVVRQGETTLRTSTLEVHYTGEMSQGDEPVGNQSISRLEARGGVVVQTKDQKATGDWAEFVMETQEVTLGGDVVLTQGDNVLRGARLVVNLESGTSKLFAAAAGERGRVQGLFIPGTMRQKQD